MLLSLTILTTLYFVHAQNYPNFTQVPRQSRYLYDDPLNYLDQTYDFIIVGSGSAGAVIANRLSENPHWQVLLLEVGEEATFFTAIPALAPLFQFTNLNWNYLMEKQDNMCLGLDDQRMAWPRGRGLGGTTLINYMIHVRGNRLDYDKWADMGNPGWSYKDVLPYFLKSENSLLRHEDPGYHSTNGYLTVEDVAARSQGVHAWVHACQQAGHKLVDYNGKRQLGVGYVQSDTKFGRRENVEKAFLRPVRSRPNLKILTRSRAVKILFDSTNKKAEGVLYVRNKQYFRAFASKEVILSAGAFNSPQLLMLSGIGPKQHLTELGIEPVHNLPVGQKLYDHLTFLGLVFTVNETSVLPTQEELEKPANFLRYIANGEGVLTTLGGVEALLYHKTNISEEKAKYPDIELIFVSGSMHTDKGQYYRKTFRISDRVYNAIWKPLEGRLAFGVLPMLVHPKSSGYLKLKSKNPYHWPKFYGNFFDDPRDVQTFIQSIREVQRIIKMPALARYGTQQVTTPVPGCEDLTFDSDAYWECALRHITGTLHHQVATCKMGPKHDPEAVVDNRLRVYGVKKLRVADTSIIPLPLTAHTNTPAIMVGEKAADLIKEEWQGNDQHKLIDIRSPK